MFVVRPSTAADLPRIVEIHNAAYDEKLTVEEFQQRDQRRTGPFTRLVAAGPNGVVAAHGLCGTGTDRDPGHYYVGVVTDPALHGRGAGRALYPELEQWALAQGAVQLESSVPDDQPEALDWARHRGFLTEGHVFFSKLDLPRWDPTPWLPAVEAVKSEGIRFSTLAAEQPGEEGLRRYHEMCTTLERDVPGRAPRTPPYETWRRELEHDPSWDPAGVILALDGDRWAALSAMERQKDGSMYTHLTAVHPSYRGRGLGLAIKVAALQYAVSQGATVATTYNHSVNQPMVAINRKFGYVPQFGSYQLFKPVAR